MVYIADDTIRAAAIRGHVTMTESELVFAQELAALVEAWWIIKRGRGRLGSLSRECAFAAAIG
jgi:hypothetical protein